jgi:Holliday junction resolvasome RuvABC endonuclease subunit
MPTTPHTIIGINPGSRYLGIAIFRGSDLHDWRIKVIKGETSHAILKKAKGLIAQLVERYAPDAIAIKKLHPARSSAYLTKLVTDITDLAQHKGIRVSAFSIKDMEAFFVGDENTNKRTLAEAIASTYPVLYHELNRERHHRNPYHIRMFEAVALGAMGFHQSDTRSNRHHQRGMG